MREELEREPADAVVTEMLLWCTTILPLALQGRPAFGPGCKSAAGPLGRLRDRTVNTMGRRMWDAALPALNQACERLIVLSPKWFDHPTPVFAAEGPLRRASAGRPAVGAGLDGPAR